jgi:hypothetical protein
MAALGILGGQPAVIVQGQADYPELVSLGSGAMEKYP